MFKFKVKRKFNLARIFIKLLLFLIGSFLIITLIITCILWNKYGNVIIEIHNEALNKIDKINANEFDSQQTSLIYDLDGNLLSKAKGDKETYYLRYSDIPSTVKEAFIAIEDHRFIEHNGVDYIALFRAFIALIKNDGNITQGGSTITQQLARTMFLSYEKSYKRKIEEIFISLELEKQYEKTDILEFYINNINYANGCYGIEAAARKYFNVSIKELSKSEMIYLCAIPQNPTYNNPYKYPNNTLRRRDNIIRSMEKYGYITTTDALMLMKEEIKLVKKEATSNNYLETYAKHSILEILMETILKFNFKYDLSDKDRKSYEIAYKEAYNKAENLLKTKGYSIYTSLSLETQGILQNKLDSALSNYNTLTSENEYSVQGAATIIDNATGLVTAIVGGRTPINHLYTINRAYQSYRQPGSSIKPLIVYAPYFSDINNTPNKIVKDQVETNSNTEKVPNGTNKKVSIQEAITWSYNAVPWNIMNEITPKKAINYLNLMKFNKIVDDDNQNVISLGGFTYGVSTLEMASAFSSFTRDGIFIPPSCVIRIVSPTGEVIYEHKNTQTVKVYSERSSRLMTQTLKEVILEGTGKAAYFDGIDIAGKTGTTNDDKDSWFVGYTPYLTMAIWAGHDTPKSEKSLSDKKITATLWKETMQVLHENILKNKEESDILHFKQYDLLDKEIEKVSNTMRDEYLVSINEKITELATYQISSKNDAELYLSMYDTVISSLKESINIIGTETYNTLYSKMLDYKRARWDTIINYISSYNQKNFSEDTGNNSAISSDKNIESTTQTYTNW